jgi:ADP-ribose pyrophosphatase
MTNRGPCSGQRKTPVEVIGDTELTVVNAHLTIARESVLFPNDQTGEFTYVKDPYVATSVVPYDKRHGQKGLVLVEQYRHPSRSWGWEVPAGRPDPGETSRQAAERELVEEAGLEAALWHQLPSQNTFIGRGNSKVDTYIAAGLEEVGMTHDSEEVINAVEWFPMDSVYGMMLSGEINSSHTLGALALAGAFIQANPNHPIARLLS